MTNRYFKTVPATMEHVDFLSENMAEADVKEVFVSSGRTPREVLVESLDICQKVYVIVEMTTGEPFAIGGYTHAGICWFLCSNKVETFNKAERISFRAELELNLEKALKVHPKLWNFIWSGNPAHIRFTESCGARLGNPILGINNEVYVPFEFLREDFEDIPFEDPWEDNEDV
ncbi:internal virion protein A [Vibrio phage 4141]|uniref:Internal virion protein A n=3 Tax=Chatterjeevirus TaxID=2732679 RepID=D0Q1C0_9CAUD|nr:internal virion protein [Vibrio phage N4]ACR16501.1 internal virion protein A [Vibrio phage N4]